MGVGFFVGLYTIIFVGPVTSETWEVVSVWVCVCGWVGGWVWVENRLWGRER